MTPFAPKRLYAALLGIALAGAPLGAFAQEGPRPSSYNNWPGMLQPNAPAAVTAAAPGPYGAPNVDPADPIFRQRAINSADPSFDGPRPSPNH